MGGMSGGEGSCPGVPLKEVAIPCGNLNSLLEGTLGKEGETKKKLGGLKGNMGEIGNCESVAPQRKSIKWDARIFEFQRGHMGVP